MMIDHPISKKKQKMLDKANATEFKPGDKLYVKYSSINLYATDKDKDRTNLCEVVKAGKELIVKSLVSSGAEEKAIKKSDIAERYLRDVGINPFDVRKDHTRPVAFQLSSILFQLNIIGDKDDKKPYQVKGIDIKDLNWNPFVYNKKGEKEYYQRKFVWSIEDKQLLIESIYKGIECGRILVRKRSWEELGKIANTGETELAFNDLVDGKQRLDAVRGFILGEYSDRQGNYFDDLSEQAQGDFTGHQLFSFAEMPENSRDEDVIYQFLKLNFAGVPQSKEHINFVSSILKKL